MQQPAHYSTHSLLQSSDPSEEPLTPYPYQFEKVEPGVLSGPFFPGLIVVGVLIIMFSIVIVLYLFRRPLGSGLPSGSLRLSDLEHPLNLSLNLIPNLIPSLLQNSPTESPPESPTESLTESPT
jgi:hypothetical protein